MQTVEEIVAEAKKLGYRLAGLFERRSFPDKPITPVQYLGYRAAFCTEGGWRMEDEGATMVEALTEALKRCKGEKGKDNRPMVTETVVPVRGAETIDMDDLI